MSEKQLRVKLVLFLLSFLLAGCENNPFTPNVELDPEVASEWLIAQERLALFVGANSFRIRPEHFSWEVFPQAFKCGTVILANGCYSFGKKKIQWNRQTPNVIRHEAGHAILDRLNHSCAHDYEHTEECTP